MSYVLDRLEAVEFKNKYDCATCSNAQWDFIAYSSGEDAPTFKDDKLYSLDGEHGYLACWCKARNMHIVTPKYLCDGYDSEQEPQLENYMNDNSDKPENVKKD